MRAILRDRRFQVGVGLFFLVDSLALAFLLLGYVVFYHRTEALCDGCAQIQVQQDFGLLGSLILEKRTVVPTGVTRLLSPGSCNHGMRPLSESVFVIAGPAGGGMSFNSKGPRFDISPLNDPLMAEALEQVLAVEPRKAGDVMVWMINAHFFQDSAVTTNIAGALERRDLQSLIRVFQSVPEPMAIWAHRLTFQASTNLPPVLLPLPE